MSTHNVCFLGEIIKVDDSPFYLYIISPFYLYIYTIARFGLCYNNNLSLHCPFRLKIILSKYGGLVGYS